MFYDEKTCKEYSIYEQHYKCLQSLIDECDKIYNKYKYIDIDTRTAVLINIRDIGYTTFALTNLLGNWANDESDAKEVIPKLLGLMDENEKSIQILGKNIQKMIKLNLLTMSQFQIENCITNIGIKIRVPFPNGRKTGYYKKCSDLINHLNINQDALYTFYTLSLIRNSLHSNGWYFDENQNFILEDVEYNFVKNEKIKCGSLPHISHAIECSLKILDEIFCTNKLLSYKGIIEDLYVKKLLTK